MSAEWQTSVSRVDDGKVLIRGYDLEALIGGQSFTSSCFLLVRGRLPSPGEQRAFDAVLNAVLDYALLKPGTVAARYAVSANPSMPIRPCPEPSVPLSPLRGWAATPRPSSTTSTASAYGA